jgi:hypothetical protein
MKIPLFRFDLANYTLVLVSESLMMYEGMIMSNVVRQ